MGKQKTAAAPPSMKHKIDLAAPVSDRVQIERVILAESVTRRRTCDAPPKKLTLNVSVTTKAREQDLIVQVSPKFTLIGQDDADGAADSLRIEAVFVVLYRVPTFAGITSENLDAFGQTNGIYNVWPYWREFVQSMTVRMGLPPLTVPVFRLFAGGVSHSPNGEEPPAEAGTKRSRRGPARRKQPTGGRKRGK